MKDMKDLAPKIDHTQLKAFAGKKEIIQLCEEALTHRFASVCVAPYYLPLVHSILGKEADVKSCTVIGFPLGYETSESKIFAAEKAIEEHAEELDVVINVAAIKDGDWSYVSNELEKLVALVRKHDKILKIIFETCYLTDDEILKLAGICAEKGVDYVKTSTGFGTGGASVHHIKLMKKGVKGKCKIKASGGIRNLADCMNMIEAGADRIGASAGVSIMQELKEI